MVEHGRRLTGNAVSSHKRADRRAISALGRRWRVQRNPIGLGELAARDRPSPQRRRHRANSKIDANRGPPFTAGICDSVRRPGPGRRFAEGVLFRHCTAVEKNNGSDRRNVHAYDLGYKRRAPANAPDQLDAANLAGDFVHNLVWVSNAARPAQSRGQRPYPRVLYCAERAVHLWQYECERTHRPATSCDDLG